MKGPIQSVEVSYLVHATEDMQKLDSSVGGLFPERGEVVVEELAGHFGNRIASVKERFTGDEAEAAFKGLTSRLSPQVRKEIRDGMGTYMDEHSALYLRLDKQGVVDGRLSLGSGDSVHVKVKPRLFAVKGSPAELFSRLLAGEG